MKTFVYIILNLFVFFGIFTTLNAQEFENPLEELVGKEWYLTKLVIDEEEIPFISTSESNQALFNVEPLYNENQSKAGLMLCGGFYVQLLFVDETDFFIGPDIILAKTNSFCDIPEVYEYKLLYFFEFWNNNNLSLTYDYGDYEYDFHFTYSIQQHENHQSLIVINDAGYEAHYQSVPYMSVDQNELSKLNIYPNPVQESFQIENLTEKSNLKIYDLSGKEIFEQEIHSSTESVDVSQLSSGLYFYGIFQEGSRVKTGKLVKE